jgi:hypothetical protein
MMHKILAFTQIRNKLIKAAKTMYKKYHFHLKESHLYKRDEIT